MFYLPQNYTNTEHLLVFHTVDAEGFLVSAAQVGFRILDPDGTQVYPASGYEDVSSTGALSTGRYYAYDSDEDAPWTVPADAALGVWKIEWEFRPTSADAVRVFSEPFEVVDSDDYEGVPYRTYISPKQVRDEGLAVADLAGDRLEALIVSAQDYIEERTGNVFRPIYRSVRLDGPAAHTIFLSMPILGIESLERRDGISVQTSSLAVAFERIDQTHRFKPRPDHRRNPKIALQQRLSVFGGRGRAFAGGTLTYTLKGSFGFLELDGSVPALIQQAAVRLVIGTYTLLGDDAASDSVAAPGPVKSWSVEDYSMTYATSSKVSTIAETATSRAVEEALAMYRSPFQIAAPRTQTGLFGRVVR